MTSVESVSCVTPPQAEKERGNSRLQLLNTLASIERRRTSVLSEDVWRNLLEDVIHCEKTENPGCFQKPIQRAVQLEKEVVARTERVILSELSRETYRACSNQCQLVSQVLQHSKASQLLADSPQCELR